MEFIDSMDIIDVDLAVALEYGKLRGASPYLQLAVSAR